MFKVLCPVCLQPYESPIPEDYICERCQTRERWLSAQEQAARIRNAKLMEYNSTLSHKMPEKPAQWLTHHPSNSSAANAALQAIADLIPQMTKWLIGDLRALHISGDNATGKTLLSFIIGHALKGKDFVFYTSGPEFWRVIASSWGGSKEDKARAAQFVENASMADLLILDELHSLDRAGDGDGVWKDVQYVVDSIAQRKACMICVANAPVENIVTSWIASSQPTHAKRAVASRIGYPGMPREFNIKTLNMDTKGVRPWVQQKLTL